MSAEDCKAVPTITDEQIGEELIGKLRLGNCSPAPQGAALRSSHRVERGVHGGVDPADKERCDASHGRHVTTACRQQLEALEVRVDDLAVTLEREDERDVDVAAFADHCPDRRYTLGGGGDLDVQVGLIDALVKRSCCGDRSCGVVSKLGRDFDGDEAV